MLHVLSIKDSRSYSLVVRLIICVFPALQKFPRLIKATLSCKKCSLGWWLVQPVQNASSFSVINLFPCYKQEESWEFFQKWRIGVIIVRKMLFKIQKIIISIVGNGCTPSLEIYSCFLSKTTQHNWHRIWAINLQEIHLLREVMKWHQMKRHFNISFVLLFMMTRSPPTQALCLWGITVIGQRDSNTLLSNSTMKTLWKLYRFRVIYGEK